MARYETSIDLETSAATAFAYLEDFSNVEDWDPGVAAAERVDDEPLTVGSRFRLTLDLPMDRQGVYTYVVDEHRSPTRVVFVTKKGSQRGRDAVTIEPRGEHACTVHWQADFGFEGVLGSVIDPVFGLVFRRIASDATDGLRTALRALETDRT